LHVVNILLESCFSISHPLFCAFFFMFFVYNRLFLFSFLPFFSLCAQVQLIFFLDFSVYIRYSYFFPITSLSPPYFNPTRSHSIQPYYLYNPDETFLSYPFPSHLPRNSLFPSLAIACSFSPWFPFTFLPSVRALSAPYQVSLVELYVSPCSSDCSHPIYYAIILSPILFLFNLNSNYKSLTC